MDKTHTLKSSIKTPIILLIIMWCIKIFEFAFNIRFSSFGILPRDKSGLIGILTSPFIHSDFNHLISNTFPFFLLCSAIFYFHKKNSLKIILFCCLLTGISVWILGRSSFHIGVSGLIYAFASFFFFNGIFHRNIKAITLSVVVLFFYGGLSVGLLPIKDGISWESHLFGAISGLLASLFFKETNHEKKYEWEDEDISNLPPPEISYKKGYPYDK